MPSPTEDLNRLRKALDIACWLLAAGRHSSEASASTEVGKSRTMHTLRAFGADYKSDYVPSENTWREVVRIMAMFEGRAARCEASHKPADPEAEYLAWAAKATEPKL